MNEIILKTPKLMVRAHKERYGMMKKHGYQTVEKLFQMEDFM
jgi:hypothetical protein